MTARRGNNHAFGTSFYPKIMRGGHEAVKKWTKRFDLFALDLLLVPVHLGVHWCLAVVDFHDKSVMYYDSYGKGNKACLDALVQYLREEHFVKKGVIIIGIKAITWVNECFNYSTSLNLMGGMLEMLFGCPIRGMDTTAEFSFASSPSA